MVVTAEDIRARVREADERRIEDRGNRAAEVAGAHTDLTVARSALADAEARFAQTVKAALDVMSPGELAEFVGLPQGELASVPGRAPMRRTVRPRKKAAPKGTERS